VAAELEDLSATADPLRGLASRRIDERVRTAMRGLSDQERSAFVMRHFEGLSIEEIGRVLNLKTSAAKHSVFRAVHKLRQALEPVAELSR
jgi:RNA polymerase sigma-70 factor (ECF subfamily)